MRTNGFELPDYSELKQILAREESRLISKEKKDAHYADFSSIINLLDFFALPTSFFTTNLTFKEWNNVDIFKQTVVLFNTLSKKIYTSHFEKNVVLLLNSVYDYLSEEDAIEKADVIFVFGSKSTYRIEKAIDLYNNGYAEKIMISGKGPFYEQSGLAESEAEILSEVALAHGIQKEALILEKNSITMPDNVKRSLNLLEKENIAHKRIILVNSPFSQRRGWAHFQKFGKNNITLFRVNTDKISKQFSRDDWYKNESGIRVILKEFFSLRLSELLNTS